MAVHQFLTPRRANQGVGIVYIAERLALPGSATVRTVVDRIRQLVEFADFPPPAAPRIWKGEAHDGARAVHAHARWTQESVDAWFDNRTPPSLRVIIDNGEVAQQANLLDQRAANLFARAGA